MTIRKIHYFVRVSVTIYDNVYNGAYVHGEQASDMFYETKEMARQALEEIASAHSYNDLSGIVLRDLDNNDLLSIRFASGTPVVLTMSVGTKIKPVEPPATVTHISV